jgi:2-C-methyl-D-erythritol 4-phosphate cytidylyltransferase
LLLKVLISEMPDIFALIPAAGSGSRMGSEVPKQYQSLAGCPLISHSIDVLCSHPRVRGVFVVLAPRDEQFRLIDLSAHQGKLDALYCGGATRAASVLNGLMAMLDVVEPDDWVMVHDAARPCLTRELIDRLLQEVGDDAVGGLLALPVADTLKRAQQFDGKAASFETVPRDGLWQAQTPQMFRYRLLLEAMRQADPAKVTDEASAIEQSGCKPRLVLGSARNLKVTLPEDLRFSEFFLKSSG